MKQPPLKPEIYFHFFEKFPGYLAFLDEKGNILSTNQTWQEVAKRKGVIIRPDAIGYNYLNLCEKVEKEEKIFALKVKEGLLKILQNKEKFFACEYEIENPSGSSERYLLYIFSLKRKPKLIALFHLKIPLEKGGNLSFKETDGSKLSFKDSDWFIFLEQVIEPFLKLLKNQAGPSLKKMSEEILKKIEDFKTQKLASLHPLAILSPKEAQIALLVKEGKKSEEIARFLNLSKDTVDFYRKRIRSKLDLKRKGISLRKYLQKLLT